MTRKADFNAEEWSLVLEGPPLAAFLVIAADRGGTLRETVSMAQAYAEARQRQGVSELFDDIVRDNPQIDRSGLQPGADLREEGLRRLREAVAVLERRATPDEVAGYRRFVTTLADHVAHAHKEGGILGIGGKEVSDREQAVLDDIARALGG